MQTVADMRGVGVKNREKIADVLYGWPLTSTHPAATPQPTIRMCLFFYVKIIEKNSVYINRYYLINCGQFF